MLEFSTGPAPIRVAVVDDQRLFSSGMAMLLEAQPDLVCVGTALNGQQAIALVEQEAPDVVLMDLRMPVMNGLEATRLLLERAAPEGPPRIIALTTIRKDEAVYSALAAGAYAFLTKDAAPDVVLATIRAAHAGAPAPTDPDAVELVREFATSNEVPEASLSRGATATPGATAIRGASATSGTSATPGATAIPAAPTADPLHDLTAREREMFALVASGRSNAEIAQTLFVTEATVKSHVRATLAKLGLRSRIQVVIFAYEHALVGA